MSPAPAQRLAGVRALVTRPKERSRELCFLLEDEGAEVVALPLLELLPPKDGRPLQAAAEAVQRYAWVLFSSPAGVQAFHEAVREAGSLDRLHRVKLGAVGPRTARALAEYGLTVSQEAAVSSGEGLLEALSGQISVRDEVLLPVAEEGRTELEEGLLRLGARVSRVCAYRSTPLRLDDGDWKALRAGPLHVIFFASPRTVEAFLEATADEGRALAAAAKRVAIGPTTAQALERSNLPADAVAGRPTPEGMVEGALAALGLTRGDG